MRGTGAPGLKVKRSDALVGHGAGVLRKLGCRDRGAPVVLAYESGLVAPWHSG